MKKARRETFPFPGVLGWAATAVVVVAYDCWAERAGRPTMSRTLGYYLHRPVIGPFLAGGWAALAYHLLIEERLTALDQALVDAVPSITEAPSL